MRIVMRTRSAHSAFSSPAIEGFQSESPRQSHLETPRVTSRPKSYEAQKGEDDGSGSRPDSDVFIVRRNEEKRVEVGAEMPGDKDRHDRLTKVERRAVAHRADEGREANEEIQLAMEMVDGRAWPKAPILANGRSEEGHPFALIEER